MGTVHKLAVVSEPEGAERRVAPRRRLLIRAAMRQAHGAALDPILIKDISSTGLRASAAGSFFVGTRLEIELPNIGWVPAEVVRADGGIICVRFHKIIDPEATQTKVTGSYAAAPPPPRSSLFRI